MLSGTDWRLATRRANSIFPAPSSRGSAIESERMYSPRSRSCCDAACSVAAVSTPDMILPDEVFDIGKAGCSSSTFWATFDEIRTALASDHPPRDRYSQVFWPKLYEALFSALGAFLFVNLLGLLFLGTRSVLRWISAGYR